MQGMEERTCAACPQTFRVNVGSSQKFHSQYCSMEGAYAWRTRHLEERERQRKKEERGDLRKRARPKTPAIETIPNTENASLLMAENITDKARSTENDENNTNANTSQRAGHRGEPSGRRPIERCKRSGQQPSLLSNWNNYEKNLELRRGNIMQEIENELTKPVVDTDGKIIPTNTSITPSGNLQRVSSESMSLVDESIGQLNRLMKYSVEGVYATFQEERSPQMINAVCNTAKAMTNLLRVKLEVAKLLRP